MNVVFKDTLGNEQTLDLEAHGSFSYNADCMEFLRKCPDKAFSLCIVDPPYGGGAQNDSEGLKADIEYHGAIVGRFGGRFEKYKLGTEIVTERRGGTWAQKYADSDEIGAHFVPRGRGKMQIWTTKYLPRVLVGTVEGGKTLPMETKSLIGT